jgi:hypothetical protein
MIEGVKKIYFPLSFQLNNNSFYLFDMTKIFFTFMLWFKLSFINKT